MTEKKGNPLTPFPSDFVPQSQKKKAKWIMQACKAAHSYNESTFLAVADSERRKYISLRKYAQGHYDNTKFKNAVSGKGNRTQANLDLQIATPLPVIRESLVGQFENQGLKPKVKCISPESQTQYDEKLREIKANRLLQQKAAQLKAAGIDVKPRLSGKLIIEDEEEIEIYMNTDFKDDYTFAMQMAIDYILAAQNIQYFKRKLYDDLVVCGKACLKLSFDQNYDIRVRYVDIVNHISDFVKNDDFSDSKYQGEYLEMTIDQLAELSEGYFDEEQLFSIAKSVANRDGNIWSQTWGMKYFPDSMHDGRPWGRFKVIVLDLEYKSNDAIKYEKVPNKKGGGFFLDKFANRPKSPDNEIVEKRLTNIYKGKWVVNTEYLFDFGLKENMTREILNGCYSGDTDFSFVTFAPDLRDMKNKSLIEKLVGLADAYVLTNLRAQTIIAKARTQGIKIDVAMLGAITNALGEKNIKPRDLIDMMEQATVYYYSSITENGTVLPNSVPVSEVPESPMNGLQALAIREQAILKAMEFATGVPLNTIGAPDKDTLVGLQKIAAENRNNAIRYIDTAYKSILSRACKNITLMVQDAISEGKKIDDYGMSIGYPNAKMLEFAKKFKAVQFGCFIDVLPDAVEQQNFIDAVNKSEQAGQIKRSQAMRLIRIGRENPELAERIMAVYEKKNTQERLAEAQNTIMAQSQAQSQAAQAIEAAKQQTITLEYDRKDKHLILEYKLKAGESTQDHEEKVKEILVEGDIKLEHIEAAKEEDDDVVEGTSLKKTSFPREAGLLEPRVFPSKV